MCARCVVLLRRARCLAADVDADALVVAARKKDQQGGGAGRWPRRDMNTNTQTNCRILGTFLSFAGACFSTFQRVAGVRCISMSTRTIPAVNFLCFIYIFSFRYI